MLALLSPLLTASLRPYGTDLRIFNNGGYESARSSPVYRFAGIRDTRNRRATSWPLAPTSIGSAAASPHPLAAGPFCAGQPSAIGVPHGSGIARCASRTRASNPL